MASSSTPDGERMSSGFWPSQILHLLDGSETKSRVFKFSQRSVIICTAVIRLQRGRDSSRSPRCTGRALQPPPQAVIPGELQPPCFDHRCSISSTDSQQEPPGMSMLVLSANTTPALLRPPKTQLALRYSQTRLRGAGDRGEGARTCVHLFINK